MLVEHAEQNESNMASVTAERDLIIMSRRLNTKRRFQELSEAAASGALENAMVILEDVGYDYEDRMFGTIGS